MLFKPDVIYIFLHDFLGHITKPRQVEIIN